MRRFAPFAVLLMLAAPAYGAPAKPVEIASVIRAAQPYGSGSYKWLLITAYDADLWTDAPRWSMQAPFALTLTYHMSFSSDEIVNRSLQEMKKDNPALSDARSAHYRALMTGAFPAAKSGDEITGLYMPGRGTQFFCNGHATGEVKSDPAFADAFFGIWLSPQTSNADLRVQLLHLGSGRS